MTGTLGDLRILFGVLLKTHSKAIILTHNHPLGTSIASGADIELARKTEKAAELFEIKVLDHLIILTDGDYFSFRDNGLMKN